MPEIEFTLQQADALLDRLSSDDTFRALFQSDVAAALQQLPGSPVPPQDMPPGGCLKPVSLASKEAIAAARDALRSQLLGVVTLQPHLLES